MSKTKYVVVGSGMTADAADRGVHDVDADGRHPVRALLAEGQSIWQDDISRETLRNGELHRQIDEVGIRGLTTNPTILERAISADQAYDDDVERLIHLGKSAHEIVEAVTVDDIRAACDLFAPLYERTSGGDGFVSLEVSPGAAQDPHATWQEAHRLWSAVDRPNLMIKIPGTERTVDAIGNLLAAGININVTLLFSAARYEQVALAYVEALERRLAMEAPIDRVASVASFFVSRVDAAVDALLDTEATATHDPARRKQLAALRGMAAIANAKLAYARFREVFSGPRWEALQAAGARVQRPLWASTSTKDPAHRDVRYVEELIGPDAVNTMPRATLDAMLDHGIVRRTADQGVDEARRVLLELATVGIDLVAVTRQLEAEGITAFGRSFDSLVARIEEKRRHLIGQVTMYPDPIPAWRTPAWRSE